MMNRILDFIEKNPEHPLSKNYHKLVMKNQKPKIIKNSALYWFPLIEKALPVPKTIFVEYNHRAFVCMIEGEEKYDTENLINNIKSSCEKIGYPCFLRTDLSSAKHDGEESYLIKSEKDIKRVISHTVSDNEMKFFMSNETPQAFMIREYLKLDYAFKAFGGLPIGREWRYFANSKNVICYHPYWPEEAIRFKKGEKVKRWRNTLKSLHKPDLRISKLKRMAIKAAKLCKDTFSVDFAMDENGKWWLIDMALAKDSWHWPNCKYSKISE